MVDQLKASFTNFWESYSSTILTLAGVAILLWSDVRDSKHELVQLRAALDSTIVSTSRLADAVNAIRGNLELETQRARREDNFHETTNADIAVRVRALELKIAGSKP